jgi:hypothetical protein
MKPIKVTISLIVLFIATGSYAMADCRDWGRKDASGDECRPWFCDEDHRDTKLFDDGFIIFPGAEIGTGSGALTAALSLNLGYKYSKFVIGTSIKGQIINIDRANYSFMPYTINISGLSYSVIPETTNEQNDKKLKGWSIGLAMGPKLTFSQLIETDPNTDSQEEFLVIAIGAGF